ncbi:hypothetical protein ACHAAC_03985 [Aeromicrobium sp. CF4.19]|uniref:hypothetical protein n=1 Tax=Aeromicrobium sp. CF4.19 TaxID=3373082 RepID=UPI003EE7A493
MEPTATQRRRWPWFAGGVLLLIGAAALALVLTGVLGSADEDGPSTPRASAELSTPTPEPDAKVSIDETESMPYTAVWNPPDEGESFWQVVDPDNGYPEDGGTDFILAHACEDGQCAGDQVRTLEAEDRLSYRGDDFVVQEKIEIDKDEIAEQEIWDHDPDRIVVITCILDPETGEYDENDIIIATRAA